MHITIPKLSLVVLIGPSGAGKSTFARKHFLPTEILSSDACRAMVSDDENNQAVTREAFEILHFIATKRLALGRLTYPRDITVLTLHRGPHVIPNPRNKTVLEGEDRLLCFGKLEEMRSMIPDRKQKRVRRLMKKHLPQETG